MVLPLLLLLCESFPILFLSKALLIFCFKGDLSFGLILVKLLRRLGWTDFFFSADWEDKFPSISQQRLPRLLSDHFPIVLEGGSFQRGRMPFRFENIWLKDESFVERVRSWWESYNVLGAPSFVLANKLKLLKMI